MVALLPVFSTPPHQFAGFVEYLELDQREDIDLLVLLGCFLCQAVILVYTEAGSNLGNLHTFGHLVDIVWLVFLKSHQWRLCAVAQ